MAWFFSGSFQNIRGRCECPTRQNDVSKASKLKSAEL
jgi:hypothetical protein